MARGVEQTDRNCDRQNGEHSPALHRCSGAGPDDQARAADDHDSQQELSHVVFIGATNGGLDPGERDAGHASVYRAYGTELTLSLEPDRLCWLGGRGAANDWDA